MRARRLPPRYADMQQWSGCVFCDRRLAELIGFLGDAPRETGGGGGRGPAGTSGRGAGAPPDARPARPPAGRGGRGSRAREADNEGEGVRNVRARGGRGGRGAAASGRGAGTTSRGRWGRGAAASGRGGGGGHGECYKCHGTGHWAANCPNGECNASILHDNSIKFY